MGKNLEFGPEYQDTDPRRLAALAQRLVHDGVDLIVSLDEEPTLAAARAGPPKAGECAENQADQAGAQDACHYRSTSAAGASAALRACWVLAARSACTRGDGSNAGWA